MAIRATETGAVFEELIGGHEITAMRHNITITAGTALKRGSIVTAAGVLVGTNKASSGGTTDVAEYVVAEDATATDTVLTVFVSGIFNREKLIVAAGDTVGAHEAELRDKNIYLTSIR